MPVVRKSRGIGRRPPLVKLPRPQDALKRRTQRRLNREPAPWLARGIPWTSVLLLSLAPFLPLVAPAPIMPPLAFMALLAWRMLRPGLFPVWAGVPLGAFDDLFSGQPFGSAILLWSAAMLALELIDVRLRWRGFYQDWAIAAAMIAAYLLATTAIANITGGATPLHVIVPQLLLSLVAHPLVARLVAGLDRLRLIPVQQVKR